VTDIITMTDLLNEFERELEVRRRVYPHWVAENKLSAGKAAHRIACMEEAVKLATPLAKKERLL
jgi:hypothetical protein